MKPTAFFLALTLIFLFTKPSLSSRAIVDDTLVYDTSGNPLQKDASYFIIPPVIGPLGGPVTLGITRYVNGTCEADVLQSRFETDPGIPFTFTAVTLNEEVIKLGKPVAIQSPTEKPCEEASAVWKVSSRIGVPIEIITTGGIINTPTSCFRISRPEAPTFPYSYMLEYCPYLCGPGAKICYPIGIYMRNEYDLRHLSPKSLSIFELVFRKAPDSAVISEVI